MNPKGYGHHPEQALVACDGGGQGCILWHSEAFYHEIEATGPALCDLGLDDAPAGLSVWEGTFYWPRPDYYGEVDGPVIEGAFRPLTDDEWAAVRENRSPWPELTRPPADPPADEPPADMDLLPLLRLD